MLEKYTFDFVTPKGKAKKIVLAKSDSESRHHIVLKLMAYLIYYDPQLKIEVGVGMRYKPDLVLIDDVGEPKLWIDCGFVAPTKARDLSRKLKTAQFVIFKKTNGEMKQYYKLISKNGDLGPLTFLSFDKDFVDGIGQYFQKKNEITLYWVEEGEHLGVCLNEQIFESQLHRLEHV